MRQTIKNIISVTSLGTLVLFGFSVIFSINTVDKTFLWVFWVTSSLATVSSRLAIRYALMYLRIRGKNQRNVLLVGSNDRAVEFARNLLKRPELGYKILGFVDNNWVGLRRFQKSGFPLVSNLKDFPAFLRSHVVDEVVVCLPLKSHYQLASEVVCRCEEQGITVRYVLDLFDLKLANAKPEQFEGATVISIATGSTMESQVFAKRTFDFVVSLVLILLLAPVFLIVALLIKVTSPGPVCFVQERLGLNKRMFRIYKFRTMVVDAEKKQAALEEFNEISGPVFKIRNDPRVTKIGRVLRKCSLDELPQIFNVLKGDMSLVGPRPLPVRDYQGFSVDWHRRRFSVKPGITCLWQISGRNNIGFDRWMEMDMEYIDRWSLWLDIKILTQTVPAVIRGSGAS